MMRLLISLPRSASRVPIEGACSRSECETVYGSVVPFAVPWCGITKPRDEHLEGSNGPRRNALLFANKFLVLLCIKEIRQFIPILDSDLHHPSSLIGIFVNGLRRLLQLGVRLGDFA